jgi:RNA recognition motif. (a.k.a. RRM, RBD, or RNP domain)
MSRMRHFSADPPIPEGQSKENESSEDDGDAFSALARKRSRTKRPQGPDEETRLEGDTDRSREPAMDDRKRPVAQTSSNKRHHGAVSDARKAKMEAILLELESETATLRSAGSGKMHRHTHLPPPRTGGSFVDPGDEHCTTNIFVGNLAPSITEEQMTELFQQFGEPLLLLLLVRFCFFGSFMEHAM